MKRCIFVCILILLFPVITMAQLINRDSLDSKKQYHSMAEALKDAENVYCVSLWSWSEKDSVNDDIAKLKNLNRLQMDNKNYKRMPSATGQLKYLQELAIYEAPALDMQHLFGQLKPLKNLKYLDVSRMNTVAYEGPNKVNLRGISALKGLEYLSVQYDHLDSLPVEVCSLKKLKILNLSSTGLTELPKEFGRLSSLEILYAGSAKEGEGNPIKHLPASFVQLKKLHTLDMTSSRLDIPAAFEVLKNMPSLRSLELGLNDLSEVPESIGELVSIESLSLYYCSVKKLPASIAKLKNLKTLDLGGNQIDPAHREEIKVWLPQTTIIF